MPDETPALGRWLKERRQALGLSREALADRAHCASSTIEKLERGDRRPSVEIATALAAALGLPPADHPAFIEWARGLPSGYLAGVPPAPTGRSPLPVPLTPLIGRARVLDEVTTLLSDPAVRLLTLVGPPGIGKTRLGLALAATLRPTFAAGVCWVALAAIHDPALVPTTIATALGVKEAAGCPLLETLHDHLRDQALLLVLDNFEQLTPAAPVVGALLEGAPALRVVVTSRAPLHLYGEYEYAVPALDLPDLAALPAPVTLAQNPAVALFLQRAAAVNARFRLTDENAAAVARLCVRLEGLPLALELAAARSKRYPPAALLRQMTRQLPLLVGGPGERTSRQQTMRGAIAWSYDLLTAAEQRVFRGLGVFVGGGTAEAVAAVVGDKSTDVAELLEGLVDESLVRSALDGETRRFGMLEMIREYAEEQLVATGEMTAARTFHAAYYLALAEAQEPRLRGAEQASALTLLTTEHDNLRATFHWALALPAVETAQRLAWTLYYFWLAGGLLNEGRIWTTRTLTVDDTRTLWWAKVTNVAANLAQTQSDYTEARTLYEAALAVYLALGNSQEAARVWTNLGINAWERGDLAAAHRYFSQGLAGHRQNGHTWNIAVCVLNLGLLAAEEADYGAARRDISAAADQLQALGDQQTATLARTNLGMVTYLEGDYTTAEQVWNECLTYYQAFRNHRFIGNLLTNLALLARDQGQYARAHARTAEALVLLQEVGRRRLLVEALIHAAGLAVLEGRPHVAAQIYGAAATGQAGLGAPLPRHVAADQVRYETQAQEALGPAYTREWQRGANLSLEQAVALVHSEATR